MTDIDTRTRAVQSDDLQLRTLVVLDLLSLLATHAFEHMDDGLEDFVNSGQDKVQNPSVKPLVDLFQRFEDPEEIAEALQNRQLNGFAVQFGTPILAHYSETSYSASWNHYRTVWVYGATFDDAWALGVAWAKERHASDLAVFLSGGKAGAV